MQCFDLSTLWASDSTSAGCVGFQNFLKSHLFYNKLITVDCGRRSLSFFFPFSVPSDESSPQQYLLVPVFNLTSSLWGCLPICGWH